MANGPADTDLHASLPRAASSSAVPAPERLAKSYQSPATYTEEESLAILDAERAGSPHPFPDREARRSGASPLPARTAEPASANVLQFSFWADERRAMPSDFIACALFAGIQEKDVAYLNDVEIANANGLRIVFKGNQLTQVHADVWQGIMHMARRQNEGTTVRFKARPFLKMIGRQTGKKQRDDLKHWFTDLTATSVEIVDSKNKRRFWGSLLPNGASQDEHDETMFVVEVSRPLAALFAENLGMVDWHVRQRLFKKPLALWWQFYSSKFRKPVAVAELHRLSGSKAKLKEFRRKLALAIQAVEKAGGVPAHLDKASDTVMFGASPERLASRPAPATTTPAAQFALPLGAPHVTDAAMKRFRELYPQRDVHQCLAAFQAWLAKSGRTAEKPDAAFLGFAKRWSTDS